MLSSECKATHQAYSSAESIKQSVQFCEHFGVYSSVLSKFRTLPLLQSESVPGFALAGTETTKPHGPFSFSHCLQLDNAKWKKNEDLK